MALPNGNMEIVFSFDTTSSMSRCLDQVRGRVSDMVQRLQADIPGIRIGIFAHGDYCDASTYVTTHVDLTDDVVKLVDFVKNVQSTYGGDADECYELVLHEVRTKLSWTPGTQRALVMIGDSDPHEPNYPQNKLKLDWRKEADALAAIGVRIYSVQCGNGADKFYNDIARRTGGHHLKLSDFKNVFDLLMTVCYRERGDDLFNVYEKEVRGRCGAFHKDLDQLFGDLRPAASDASSDASTSKHKPTKVTGTKISTTTLAKKTTPPKATRAIVKLDPKKIRRPRKATTKNPFADKNLPKLRREQVPENNFILREMKWSQWQMVMAKDQFGTERNTRKISCGFRLKQLFRGKTNVPAFYEIAVQPWKPRCRKYVVYSKFCRKGFKDATQWGRNLLALPRIRQQTRKIVLSGGKVWIRRVVVRGDKSEQNIKSAQRRYDYAWRTTRSEVARDVTCAGMQISCAHC